MPGGGGQPTRPGAEGPAHWSYPTPASGWGQGAHSRSVCEAGSGWVLGGPQATLPAPCTFRIAAYVEHPPHLAPCRGCSQRTCSSVPPPHCLGLSRVSAVAWPRF